MKVGKRKILYHKREALHPNPLKVILSVNP